jgi:hypothetical protein
MITAVRATNFTYVKYVSEFDFESNKKANNLSAAYCNMKPSQMYGMITSGRQQA